MTGKKIRELRKAKNLTMSELANICKISQSYISDLENGNVKNPSITKMEKIAEALGVSLDELREHKKAMKSFANSWNGKSEEERNSIINKTKEKWETEEKEAIINTIINIADKADTIDFFLNEDNTMNYEKSKQMFDIFVNTMKLIANSSDKNK